jgi:serine/threonine protein phosphatase PrpC
METHPSPVLPAIEYAERSDPGRDPDKQVNEDACVCRRTRFGHLCVVCDGLGGHAAGREAAELAVSTVLDAFEHAAEGVAPCQVLVSAIMQANHGVFAMRPVEMGAGRPGCTLVAALMHAHGTEIAHVGDSRAYLVHEGQIFRITRDHSIVQELVDRGLITPQQAAHHPDANRITRALGIAPEVEPEARASPVHHRAGDAFVLCSDGLSDLVEEHEILAIVANEPAAQAVGKLVDLANARGGHDNITVVVLRARESALSPQAAVAAVAPTMAQTSGPQGPGLEATALPPPTEASAKVPITELLLAAPISLAPRVGLAGSAPWRTEPAAPGPPASGSRSHTAVVAIGLVLACIAAALLGAVLFLHFAERRGKRNAGSEPAIGILSVDAAVGGGPTTLSPEAVVLPSAAVPAGEPIAPLEPSPTESKRRKR